MIIQEEIIKKCGEVWNLAMLIEKQDLNQQSLNADDIKDIRTAIHSIQNIMYTQLYIKQNGKV